MNDKVSPKERGLIKGALRRVFSRSELRRRVLDTRDVIHSDPLRPRVKKWSRCEACQEIKPKYTCAVDHILPLIPLDRSLEEMTWDEVIDRLWCESKNLQVLCETCHDQKTSTERKERTKNKALKRSLDVKPKRVKKTAKKCRPGDSTRTTHKRVRERTIQDFRGKSQKTRR